MTHNDASDNKQWLCMLAYLYIQQQQPDNAITLLKTSLILHSDDKQTNKMLALAYLRNRQYQASLAIVDQLISDETSHENIIPLRLMRAKALWALEQKKAAQQTIGLH